jgi:hypothetical protein
MGNNDIVNVAPNMTHTSLSGNIHDVDYAGARPLPVVRISPDVKIFISTDNRHT